MRATMQRYEAHGICPGKPCESGVTRQEVRLKKEQEPRPEGAYVILRNLDLVVSHLVMFTEQREMQHAGKEKNVKP